jgi:GntR family transcriptional regulator
MTMASHTSASADTVRRDAVPHLWEQVAARIEAETESNEPGARLPSEAVQANRLGVSRVTVRQALLRLQKRGLIESMPGRGWFVADGTTPKPAPPAAGPLFEPPGKLMGFSEMARMKGSFPDSVVLEQETRPATFEEAEALAIMPGDDVFLLRRVRRLNGAPVAVDRSVVPLHILPSAPTIDFMRASLHASFNAADATVVAAETEVEAIIADSELAGLLKVDIGFPLLKVRQAFFDARGRVLERGVIIYRSDRYRFRSRLRA